MANKLNINSIKQDAENLMKSIHQFDDEMEKKNQELLLLVEQLRDVIPQEQIERVESIVKSTIENVKPAPDFSDFPPIEVDERNPLESLRKIRIDISQELCRVMDVEPPTV